MSLTVCTWLWGTKFGPEDVAKLAAGVKRNLRQPHRFICVTDREEFFNAGIWSQAIGADILATPMWSRGLTKVKGCFARLEMFNPEWQQEIGVKSGDRIVLVDLDSVITGQLDPLFDRPESFLIMQKGNASNPCPFNGALQMLRAGAHPEVWADFSLEAAAKTAHYEFPDDQGWLWHKLPNAAGWVCGQESGVYVYQKRGWPGGKVNIKLPDGARLVTFINKTPEAVGHLDWVKDNWHDRAA
jgi:hypothetical protein